MDEALKQLIIERDALAEQLHAAGEEAQAAFDEYVVLSEKRSQLSNKYFELCDKVDVIIEAQIAIGMAECRPAQGSDS